MKGTITSYRRSRHRQHPKQVLIKVEDVDSVKKAHELLGKKVIVTLSKDNKMDGKITDTHGGKGIVRARFKKGVPGQAIGNKCEIK